MSADVVDVGIDYLTLTAREGEIAGTLLEAGYTLANVEKSVTHTQGKPQSISGYRGEQVGRVFYGEGNQGIMVRASSNAADSLLLLMGASAKRCNVPRIDIQVTGRFEFDRYYYAQQTAQKARAASVGASAGRPANVALHDSGPRGSTCAIGSRSSSRFIRIYDKTREQSLEVDQNLWRWEVEYKPPLSPAVLCQVLDAADTITYIRSMVWGECYVKGVEPPWTIEGRVDIARVGRVPTDVERTLNWLKSAVAPAIRRLERGGYIEECISALGLTGAVKPDSIEMSRE